MSSNEFNFAGAGIRVVDFIPNSDGFKSLGLGGASFFLHSAKTRTEPERWNMLEPWNLLLGFKDGLMESCKRVLELKLVSW